MTATSLNPIANTVVSKPWLALLLLVALAGGLLAGADLHAEPVAININTASAEEIAEGLSGIGMAKAYRIIEYRESYGPFERIDELQDVSGIGAAIVERNREVIVLQ